MSLPGHHRPNTETDAPDIYSFRREYSRWYIDLPAYLEQGWTNQDLQLTEGAHKFLNRLAGGAQKLRLRLCTGAAEEMDVLELVEHCDAPRGGAIYLYRKSKGQTGSELFWICDLALFVFGDMPERIYVQRLSGKDKQPAEQRNGSPVCNDREQGHRFPDYQVSFHHQRK